MFIDENAFFEQSTTGEMVSELLVGIDYEISSAKNHGDFNNPNNVQRDT